MARKWIQGAVKKPGALRKQLGIKKGQKIPLAKLQWAARQGGKMGQRARLALMFRGFGKKRRTTKRKHRG